jgi:sulfoxide reductase heme-binding subunit YedZ
MRRIINSPWAKPFVFLLLLAPLATLAVRAYTGSLGVNPIETVTRATGEWTLRFLLFTLTITPLRRLSGIPDLIRFRRMAGLFAFFYGALHLVTWLWLDKFFDLDEMAQDVVKRRFIAAGFVAFLAMVPLAVTSTRGWIRRLGRRWQMLHRLVYLSAAAGVVHYIWLVKADLRAPLAYAATLVLLMALRFVKRAA